MKITDEEIRRISSASIYKRGLEYFRNGRVHIKSREDSGITAMVDGESIYSVRIDFENDMVKNTMCTCPYYQTMGSNCKHIVAVLKKRQSELLENGTVKDGNDQLAQLLCSEFANNCFVKKRLNIKFILNITSAHDRSCTYEIGLMCGFDKPVPVNGIDSFFECYINREDFKISKHTAINSSDYSLGANEQKILDILCEAYQNRICETSYVKRVSQAYIAPQTAKRILPLLFLCECDYYFNSIQLNDCRIIEDNPDILIDINATDDEISLNVSESGTALFRDGSWYFYDGCFYHTDSEWREWFMPVYNSLMSESRTQIDFRGNSRIDFAAYVYPKLRNKQGVVTSGVDSIVVNEKPEFSVYLDTKSNSVIAVVTAKYGAIDIRLPIEYHAGEKIVIRDIPAEKKILSYFRNFSHKDGLYTLTDDTDIYNFITETLPELNKNVQIYASDAFERLNIRKDISIKANVSYKSNIDLLEIGFETELSADEIKGLLKSAILKNNYYRLHDGSFLTLDEENAGKFRLLNDLNFTEKDIKNSKKLLSKYHILYFEALEKDGVVETDSAFDELLEKVRKIDADIPDYLKNVLRDYQARGVCWLKQLSELGFGGVLADDMGLGKTLEVIAFVMSEKKEKPALVVAPSALIYNWLNEINKFAPCAMVKIIDGSKEDRAELLKNISGYDFVITSYPLLRRDISMYADSEFSYMFIDESQHIKNPDTMNAKAVKKINAKRYFALSGTPVENNLTELWSVFDFVMRGYLGTRREFSAVYETIKSDDAGYELEKLYKKISPFVMRRMKADVLNELPEKIESTVYCELMPEQKKMYEAFHAAARDEIGYLSDTREGGIQMLTLLLRLRQICCHPGLFDTSYKKESGKLILLGELIDTALSQGRRILIFSQFTSMLGIIREELKKKELDCFFIDGKTPPERRTQMAERFNNGEKSLFLVSLKAGGTGLNLIGADMVIHYDPWWNPAVTSQATDRAYRIGQTKAVQVIKLAAKGTIEEQILKLQEAKQNLADSIIKRNDKTISGLTKEEILSLFE